MPKAPALAALALLLSACAPAPARPVIGFVGIGTGTLQTDLAQLSFRDRFEPSQRELIGVVAFEHVADGTIVQADWHAPDDRAPPLGRTTVVTQSGAKIARFSFARNEDWDASPYLLNVFALVGEGEEQQTASGSVQFFIGMTDEEIAAYRDAYAAWEREEKDPSVEG